MPTLNVKRDQLLRAMGQPLSEQQFSDLCFDYGLELDEVVADEQTGDTVYKVDIPANRHDLLCLEGLARSLLVFQGRAQMPTFSTVPGPIELEVRPATARIRPFVVAAVLRDITFTQAVYDSFIDLQDKLHHNIGRRRSLVAIGTHDLDTVEAPFVYDALSPDQIRFRPLARDREYTALQLMQLYSGDSHLKPYLALIRDSPVYPVIRDARGAVLSMPPIINGHQSRITLATRNVFIECTATDLRRAQTVLATLVAMFSQYCRRPYQCETVRVLDALTTPTAAAATTTSGSGGGRRGTLVCPDLSSRRVTLDAAAVAATIGVNCDRDLPPAKLAQLLTRMGHQCQSDKPSSGDDQRQRQLSVVVPVTRHDVLAACDLMEDAAIAYGYNNIGHRVPDFGTVAEQNALNQLSDQIRQHVAQAGFAEALTFALCARDDLGARLRQPPARAVQLANPKTVEFQVVRSTLVPGLLKTVASNRGQPLPLRVFECCDVVLLERTAETGAVNERHLAALYCGRSAGFEVVHGLLDRLMQLLQVAHCDAGGSCDTGAGAAAGYRLRAADCDTYLADRCADVLVDGVTVGRLGVLHPDVVANFELTMPCSVLEINIEHFV